MTAPPRFPSEYATFRRQVRVATVRLPKPCDLSTRVEDAVADCGEAFALAAGLNNGERAGLIKAWGSRLERSVVASLLAEGPEVVRERDAVIEARRTEWAS